MRASDALVAWNGAECLIGAAPPMSVAVGPLLRDGDADWTEPYRCTGGASNSYRRKMDGTAQEFEVLAEWYGLVFGYGVHPVIAHRAFLHIDEYQTLVKRIGWGPGKGEPGHDPNTPHGRLDYPTPEFDVHEQHGVVHVWPRITSG